MQRNLERIADICLLDDEDDDATVDLLLLIPFKRKSTREMILNREKEGTFNMLIKKYLLSEEDEFMKYFRVSRNLFHTILDHISADITSEPSNRTPMPISAEQKLCVTLR